MNPDYFGDSYDLVKRFFCSELVALGYCVFARPMFTGQWNGTERSFLRFIGATEECQGEPSSRSALFFDPDTGVHAKASSKHISLRNFAAATESHAIAFSFDQSFSRQHDAAVGMRQKLAYLADNGCNAMYYNSHARFLFASRVESALGELRRHLVELGMPESRFVAHDA